MTETTDAGAVKGPDKRVPSEWGIAVVGALGLRSMLISPKRNTAAATVLAVCLTFAFAGFALGYYSVVVNWYIPFMNGQHYTGWGCMNGREFSYSAVDYHTCSGAEVAQSTPGTFTWYGAFGCCGVEYNPPAWYGDFWIWDQASGALLMHNSGFYCSRITNNPVGYFFVTNPSSQGTLQQQSGAGDVGCGLNYINDLYLAVIGF